jgi:hypothetical protein
MAISGSKGEVRVVWIYERVDELSRDNFEVSLDFSGARVV